VDACHCLTKCDGLFITGIERREFDQQQLETILSKVKDDYEKFKTGNKVKMPSNFGGKLLRNNMTFHIVTNLY